MLGMFITFFVPAAYLHFIDNHIEESSKSLSNDPAIDLTNIQYPLAVIQSIGMLYLMFVSFYKSPFTDLNLMDMYLKYVPFVHAGVTVLIFVVIPVFVIVQTLI